MPSLPGIPRLPEWLDVEAWEEFCKMRRQMKRVPFTDYAQRCFIKDLTRWHEQNYDTTYILQEAVMKGWRGLFVNERTPRRQPERTQEPVTPRLREVFQKIEDYEHRKANKQYLRDEQGRQFLVSPTSGKKLYVSRQGFLVDPDLA